MDFIITFLRNPVTIGTLFGLGFGLILTLIALIRTRIFKRELEDEIADARYDYRRLEDQMNTQMRVGAKAQEELLKEIEEHKAIIHNLELSLSKRNSKAGRKELRSLHIFERAEEILAKKSPGSILAWENAKNEAEADFQDADKGFKPLFRKVFGSESTGSPENPESKS
jgi:hypothetical protein